MILPSIIFSAQPCSLDYTRDKKKLFTTPLIRLNNVSRVSLPFLLSYVTLDKSSLPPMLLAWPGWDMVLRLGQVCCCYLVYC